MSGSDRRASLSLQRDALELIMNAKSGAATAADLQCLEEWRQRSSAHTEAYRKAVSIWDALGTAARETATAQDRDFIAGRRAARTHAVGRRAFLVGGLAASAAASALVMVQPSLGVRPFVADLFADYRTETGEQRSITLDEGVSVEMNTRTSIDRRLSAHGTSMELISGEAAISAECSEERPVSVLAAGGRSHSSKAKFAVRHGGGPVRVACLEGAVLVEHDGNSATLRAEQQLSYSDRGIGPITTFDPTVVAAWQRGLLIFREEPLVNVLAEVNRYWQGRIILLNADLGQRRVTARIELARVGEVISYVRSVLGAQVRTLPGGVVLLS